MILALILALSIEVGQDHSQEFWSQPIEWQICVENSDYSDASLEACDAKFDPNWKEED